MRMAKIMSPEDYVLKEVKGEQIILFYFITVGFILLNYTVKCFLSVTSCDDDDTNM